MFHWIGQTVAVTAAQPADDPAAAGSSGVAIVGIAGVVVVLVSVLSIAAGFTAAMRRLGSPARALVMRSGADSEMTSGLGGTGGRTSSSRRRASAATARRRSPRPSCTSSSTCRRSAPARPPTCRCAASSPQTLAVRDEASIVEGRMFEFGTNEVVVGRGASGQFAGLTVGNEMRSGQNTWKVVGIFEADGGVAETEIWCDVRVLQGAYRRGNTYQSVLARLDSTDSFDTFRDWLTSNPQLNVQVRRETEYYAQQSRALSQPDPGRSASASPR